MSGKGLANEDGRSFHLEYSVAQKLGAGSFGAVYAVDRVCSGGGGSGEELAVKIIDLRLKSPRGGYEDASVALNTGRLEAAVHEASCMRRASVAVGAARIVDFFMQDGLSYMVMERGQESLLEFLDRQPSRPSEAMLKSIVSDMLSAIAGIHAAGVVHRDVKLDNFMLFSGPKSMVKLCDFGLAMEVPDAYETELTGHAGTLPFMAPELLSDESSTYSGKIDVWAAGVAIHLLLFDKLPFKTERSRAAMLRSVRAGLQLLSREASVEEDVGMQLVRSLLQRRPTERPTAAEALAIHETLANCGRFGCTINSTDLPGRSLTGGASRAFSAAASLQRRASGALRRIASRRPNLEEFTDVDELLETLQAKATATRAERAAAAGGHVAPDVPAIVTHVAAPTRPAPIGAQWPPAAAVQLPGLIVSPRSVSKAGPAAVAATGGAAAAVPAAHPGLNIPGGAAMVGVGGGHVRQQTIGTTAPVALAPTRRTLLLVPPAAGPAAASDVSTEVGSLRTLASTGS